MVRMRRSRSLRTSSLTASSSGGGRYCMTKSKRQSERPATKRCLDARGWEGSVWECETWRGAVLGECCCVATAMGEWGQAVEDSWEEGGEEAEAGGEGEGEGEGLRMDVM